MARFKRTVIIVLLTTVILVPLAAVAHLMIFPQQTRSIFVDYSDLKRNDRLYFSSNTPPQKIDSLKLLLDKAALRLASFWGEKSGKPKFIYCNNEADFKRFGSPAPVPAVTHLKFGAYIVISADGMDLDILAHEISHVEFYEKIGFYNWTFKVPAWFDEGLAMQNDYRQYYSADTLKAKTNNYRDLPDIRKLTTGAQFNTGSTEQVMLNYMAARFEVHNWLSRKKLSALIRALQRGKTFNEAYMP